MNRWFVFLVLCFAAATVLAAGLICSKCGYENAENAGVCSHCSAQLPAREAKRGDSRATGIIAASDGKAVFLDSETVAREIDEAESAGEKNHDPEVACLLLKNAAALDLLTMPDPTKEREAKIRGLLDKYGLEAGKLVGKCDLCGGTGKIVEKEAKENSCPKCKGTGTSQVKGTVDDLKLRMGAAGRRYSQLQQSRKMLPVGGAWVPADFDPVMTTRQTVILRCALAAPCPDCLGLGCMKCPKCKGSGEIKCTANGCENGTVTREKSAELSKTKFLRTSKCAVCRGIGRITCPDCSRGTVLCKRCNGSRERQLCADCAGKGIKPCRKCAGTGTFKDADCPECRGEGIVACPKCKGDGRKS